MRITREIGRDGNLVPSVWNTLSAVPDSCIHHDVHRLRHPRSTYRLSLVKIAGHYESVLNLYERSWLSHFVGNQTDLSELLSVQQSLLFDLHEHFDASASILRSFCNLQRAAKFDHQYLDQMRLPGWISYRGAMRSYAGLHIGEIVNRIKHRGAHLEWIWFESEKDFRPGYFLCGIQKGGTLGADPTVHPGGNSALSFARELLLGMWWIYRHGDLLRHAVLSTVGPNASSADTASNVTFDGGQQWQDVLIKLSRLRILLFPNELRLPCPRICFDQTKCRLTIDMPGIVPSKVFPKRVRVKASMGGMDAEHRTYKIPYMGKDGEP